MRFDDRERGERAVSAILGEAGGALEQAAVEVEHIAGERLAAGRAFEQERDLAVGVGLFGKVVEDDEGIHAIVHEPFAHRGSGERGDVLVGRRIGGCGGKDDGVFQGVVFLEGGNDAGDVGVFLTDRDIDRIERTEGGVARLGAGAVDARLVDDGVDGDGGLAGGAVADDEFALAAADRDHGVDAHDAGLDGLADRAAFDDARGDFFNRVGGVVRDRALAVDGRAEGVDDAAEEALAHGDGEELAGGLDLVALADAGVVAEEDGADLGFLEVERDAHDAAGEFHHFVELGGAEAFDAGDAVADFADGSDIGLAGGLALDAGDFFFEFEDDVAHGFLNRFRSFSGLRGGTGCCRPRHRCPRGRGGRR